MDTSRVKATASCVKAAEEDHGEWRMQDGQVLLQVLLPYLVEDPGDKAVCTIAGISQQCRADVKAFIAGNVTQFLERALGKRQKDWEKNLPTGRLGWVCRMAGKEAMAQPVVAATVLQYMQEALGSADEVDADKAQALLQFMAEAGMQITDHLLVMGAKLHNQYVGRMPQLLFQHSCFRDDAGDGLTGLGFDVEAVALGLQSVQVWLETGVVPPNLPDLLRVACYVHKDDSSCFDTLLEIDREHSKLLFTAPAEGAGDSTGEGAGDASGAGQPQQTEQDKSEAIPDTALLADLVQTSALDGNSTRADMLLALPVAQAISVEKLFEVLHTMVAEIQNRVQGNARGVTEQVFVTMCQLPNARRNVKARSDMIEACLLMMPNAMAMTPDDILELLPRALHGCRLQVVKYLSVLCRSAELDPAGVLMMMRGFIRSCNATTFPFLVSDLVAFSFHKYLDHEAVMVLLAESTRSMCVVEATKYFSTMPAARQLHPITLVDIIEFFVKSRHYSQHNTLAEAAKVLLSLPAAQQVSNEQAQELLKAALHSGCFACVKALQKRWPHLNGFYKRLEAEHLVAALTAAFTHSRCAPEELVKGIVNHPNAKLVTAAELEPVLQLVCSDTPFGIMDCDNDGCGTSGTATAPEVLEPAPGQPLQKLLLLPGVKDVPADTLAKLIILSYEQLGDDVLVYHLTATHAKAAADQLPQTTQLGLLKRLVTQKTAESLAALKALLAAPSVQQLEPEAVVGLLQAGVEGNGADEHLQLLARLPRLQDLTATQVAAAVQPAAAQGYALVCAQLLQLPNTPQDPVFKSFVKRMEKECAALVAET